jgi:hypothetical protein
MEQTTQDLIAKVRPAAPVNRIAQNQPSPAAFMMCSWCGARGEDVGRTPQGHRCAKCLDQPRQPRNRKWWPFNGWRYR